MSVAEQVAKRQEQRALLARRPDEIVELERDLRSRLESSALAAHGDEQTRSSLTASDVDSLQTGEWAADDRQISAGRLYLDCARTVPYLTRGFSRRDRQAIANIAAAYICEHIAPTEDWTVRLERQAAARAGSARAGSIGQSVVRYIGLLMEPPATPPLCGLPLRRDWLDADSRPTEHAWKLMRVAIRHGARNFKAGTSTQAVLMDGESLAALAEREGDTPEVETGSTFGALADARANDLATVMGLPLNAARAIEHDALVTRYLGSIPADASEEDRAAGIKLAASLALDAIAAREQISRAGLKVAISRGHGILKDRYPEPRELRAALQDACAALRTMATDRLALALSDYADGEATEAEARAALAEYQSSYAGLSPSRSALERAYIRHALRAGTPLAGALEHAPMVSLWASRLMGAEHRRARVLAARRTVTTGTARMLAGNTARILRSGGYGNRTARLYPHRAPTMMLTREARRTMVALAGAEWRASCES